MNDGFCFVVVDDFGFNVFVGCKFLLWSCCFDEFDVIVEIVIDFLGGVD